MVTTKVLARFRIVRDTRGQDMIEYALIAAFLATFACAALPGVTGALDATVQKVSSALTCAANTNCSASTGVTP